MLVILSFSEGTGTHLVGYGSASGWLLSSQVRLGFGRSFKMLGRLAGCTWKTKKKNGF